MKLRAFAFGFILLLLGSALTAAQSYHAYVPASASDAAAVGAIPNMTVSFAAVDTYLCSDGSTLQQTVSAAYSDSPSFQLANLWDSPGDLIANASGNNADVVSKVFTVNLQTGASLFQGRSLTNTAQDFGGGIFPYDFAVSVA